MATALITGASSGLGEEFARQLARENYDLVLTARREDRLKAVAAEAMKLGSSKVEVIASDLGQPDAAAKLHRQVSERGIEIECLVNNAGFGTHGIFHKTAARARDRRDQPQHHRTGFAHAPLPRRDGGATTRHHHQCGLDRRVPTDSLHGDLCGDQGIRAQLLRGGRARSKRRRRHGDGALSGPHSHRVPGHRRRRRVRRFHLSRTWMRRPSWRRRWRRRNAANRYASTAS